MRQKMLLAVILLALASVASLAADQNGFIVTSNGRFVITKKGHTNTPTAFDPGDASLVKIFDNIGTYYPRGPYYCCEGWTIAGPLTGQQQSFPELWEVAAFVPAADHTVSKIEVAGENPGR